MSWLLVILLMLLSLVLSLLIALRLGHTVTNHVVGLLQKRSGIPGGQISKEVGIAERMAVIVAWMLGFPQFICFWLAIKLFARCQIKYNDNNPEKAASAMNIFLVGNLVSVGFGILGGIILQGLLAYIDIIR